MYRYTYTHGVSMLGALDFGSFIWSLEQWNLACWALPKQRQDGAYVDGVGKIFVAFSDSYQGVWMLQGAQDPGTCLV